MEDDPALEHALLQHLRFAPLTRAELVRRTGVSDGRVQAALNELVSGTFVVRRPQDVGPADYELTEVGTGRLKLSEDFVGAPGKTLVKVFGAMLIQLVRPPRPSPAAPYWVRPGIWGTVVWVLLVVVVVIAVVVPQVI